MQEGFTIVELEKTGRRFGWVNALAGLIVQTVTNMPGGFKVKGPLNDSMFQQGNEEDYKKQLKERKVPSALIKMVKGFGDHPDSD